MNCEICGEVIPEDGVLVGVPAIGMEVGEFVTPDGDHILAHASCGEGADMELA